MRKIITQPEKLQLLGLLVLADKHRKIVEDADNQMHEIVNAEQGSQLTDAIYESNLDIDSILKCMGIEVIG